MSHFDHVYLQCYGLSMFYWGLGAPKGEYARKHVARQAACLDFFRFGHDCGYRICGFSTKSSL